MQQTKNGLFLIVLIVMMFGCASVADDWNRTSRMNTIDSYQSFLNRYPESQFTNEAKNRLSSLQKQADEKPLQNELIDAIKGLRTNDYGDQLNDEFSALMEKMDLFIKKYSKRQPVILPGADRHGFMMLIESNKASLSFDKKSGIIKANFGDYGHGIKQQILAKHLASLKLTKSTADSSTGVLGKIIDTRKVNMLTFTFLSMNNYRVIYIDVVETLVNGAATGWRNSCSWTLSEVSDEGVNEAEKLAQQFNGILQQLQDKIKK